MIAVVFIYISSRRSSSYLYIVYCVIVVSEYESLMKIITYHMSHSFLDKQTKRQYERLNNGVYDLWLPVFGMSATF